MTSPELVVVEARRAATRPANDPQDTASPSGATVLRLPVTPATEPQDGPDDGPDGPRDGPHDEGLADVVRHQLAGLPGERPLPSVAHYDQLLTQGPAHAGRRTPEPGLPTG